MTNKQKMRRDGNGGFLAVGERDVKRDGGRWWKTTEKKSWEGGGVHKQTDSSVRQTLGLC